MVHLKIVRAKAKNTFPVVSCQDSFSFLTPSFVKQQFPITAMSRHNCGINIVQMTDLRLFAN